MTQEDKELLLKDLCGRLPYKTICKQVIDGETLDCELSVGALGLLQYNALEIKPYLRPMSSMTEDEVRDMLEAMFPNRWFAKIEVMNNKVRCQTNDWDGRVYFFEEIYSTKQLDWLLEHHFDYRGLIEKGLALEAPEDMYKND